ncbi:MAG: hypothetical protein AB2792_22185 [Candidatus Thiodiazotropha sp.]
MKRGSKEFYELLDSFESCARNISGTYIYDFERYKPEPGEKCMDGQYYNNGTTNAAFNVYMAGYQHAKCKARVEDLPLND